MERGNRKVQYLITLAVSLSSITAGVSVAWSTLVIPKFHNNETNIHITDSEISWMAAVSAPGFITGSLATRFTSEKFGRRATILGSSLPIAIGTVFIVTSVHAWMFYTARFLWGCGAGMLATVCNIYLAEIADKDIRGSLTAAPRIMFFLGSFLMLCIGPWVSYEILNYMLLALPVIYFVVCWWIPETPYYYLKEGRVDCARKELLKLSGCKNETVLEERLLLMQSDVRKEMNRSSSLIELFTGKQYRRALIIVIVRAIYHNKWRNFLLYLAIISHLAHDTLPLTLTRLGVQLHLLALLTSVGLKLIQIATGTDATMHYFGLIIQESKSTINNYTALSVYGAIRFIVGAMSSMLVDRLGRRPLLIYSYIGAGISLTVVGAYFFKQEVISGENETSAYGFIPLVGIISSTMLSSFGFDILSGVIAAEIFPINVKAVAMTFLNIVGGLCTFTTVKSFQNLKDLAGLCGVFWCYASSAFIGAIFTYFVVPETKGKSLRDIQIQLHKKNIYDDVVCNENETRELKEIERKEGL